MCKASTIKHIANRVKENSPRKLRGRKITRNRVKESAPRKHRDRKITRNRA